MQMNVLKEDFFKMGNKINYSPRLPKLFKELGMDNYKSLFLVDVGASGGIDNRWNLFEEKLEAIGFDPLIAEVERLNKLNTNPNVKYEDAFLIYKDLDKYYTKELRSKDFTFYNSFARSSAVRASNAQSYSYVQEHFNDGKELVYSDKFIELDDYVDEKNITDIDFIKIDTDSNDFPVLLGAEKVFDNCNVLGVQIEAQFHGAPHPYSSTFSNIDMFLRSRGFTLSTMDTYFYSRAALPLEFLYELFAQTKIGKIEFGEAFYFRDLGNKNYTERYNFPVTLDKVIKLACLYEMHGLNDCAAELLINRADEFGFTQHLDVLLDALTPSFRGNQLTYKEYIKRFNENPKEWFPSVEGKINERLFGDASGKRGLLVKLLSWGYKLLKKFK